MNTKMVNGIKLVASVVFLIAVALNIGFSIDDSQMLTFSNIEILAEETTGDCDHCPNFKSGSYWVPDGWIVGHWITCCLMGTDMDGCKFCLEDSECKQVIERPSGCDDGPA